MVSANAAYGADALRVDAQGNVGIGTDTPDADLDVESDGPRLFLSNSGTAGGGWDIGVNGNTGRLTFRDIGGGSVIPFKFDPGAVGNLLTIGVRGADKVEVNGDLNVTGDLTVEGSFPTPDYVFAPGYRIDSIEDHAAAMWTNHHLPGVGPGRINAQGQAVINLANRSQGVLLELELAHVYIDQLQTQLRELSAEKSELEKTVGRIVEELDVRLARLEADQP